MHSHSETPARNGRVRCSRRNSTTVRDPTVTPGRMIAPETPRTSTPIVTGAMLWPALSVQETVGVRPASGCHLSFRTRFFMLLLSRISHAPPPPVGMQGSSREVQSVRGFTTFSRVVPLTALYSPQRQVPFHMLRTIEHIVAGAGRSEIVFADRRGIGRHRFATGQRYIVCTPFLTQRIG